MKRIIIESPYAGKDFNETLRNRGYLQACMHDAVVNHNESPYASHGLLTQNGVLDDKIPEERNLGIQAGLLWAHVADYVVVYTDFGISRGMKLGIEHHKEHDIEVKMRTLPVAAMEKFKREWG